jgi:hypothetical protein
VAELQAAEFAKRARELGYLLVGLADLADKYAALAELRAGVPGRTRERRDAMRRIADRFPAALRELDQSSADDLDARAREIGDTLRALVHDLEAGPALAALSRPERAWLRAAAELHAYMRELLKVKRWLAGRAVTPQILDEFATWYAEHADSRWPLWHWNRARLAGIAAPPRGRATDLAYEEVAARQGIDATRLRQALFPLTESEPDADAEPDEGPT